MHISVPCFRLKPNWLSLVRRMSFLIRYIRILTSISKVIEKCINQQIILTNGFNQDALSDLISAYRKGYSCHAHLTKHAISHSEVATLILMDLSKAFDCFKIFFLTTI